MEPDNFTLAFSDQVRIFSFPDERLGTTSAVRAKDVLGFLHFLTPTREALHAVVESDNQAKSIVLANAGSGSAALDAAKSSRLCTGGRLAEAHHVHEAIANFRCFVSTNCGCNVDQSLLVEKLLECAAVLTDRHCHVFFDMHRHHPNIAIHLCQDVQLILTSFAMVANNIDLHKSVMAGTTVALSNCATAVSVPLPSLPRGETPSV